MNQTKEINKQLALMILDSLSDEKAAQLTKALNINNHLTTNRSLDFGELTVYKEGFYLELFGCRCGFKVYAQDNDGELIIQRKPLERKMHKLYKNRLDFEESDFKKF